MLYIPLYPHQNLITANQIPNISIIYIYIYGRTPHDLPATSSNIILCLSGMVPMGTSRRHFPGRGRSLFAIRPSGGCLQRLWQSPEIAGT